MSRFIIIQEAGSDQLLLVDKDTKTVEEIDASMLDEMDDDETGAAIHAARHGGEPLLQGITAAIAGTQRMELSGRYYYSSAA